MCSSTCDHSLRQFRKISHEQFASITPNFHQELSSGLLRLRLILSCGWIRVAAVSRPGGWIRPSRVPAAGYKLRLTPSYGWLEFRLLELPPIPSQGWLELRQLDTSYSWLHPTANSSFGTWIRLKVDSILRLTTSCGWFYSAADSSPPSGHDLWLTYALIYQVNLRTYSAKYIIFMVCFLPTDFSYHRSRLCLLLFKNLEEAWRSFKTLAVPDSSCSGWFETCNQSTTSRILTPMPPDTILGQFIYLFIYF